MNEGASEYRALNPNDAWSKIKQRVRKSGANEAVLVKIQQNRQQCRAQYETRRVIVHAGCVGVWKKDRRFAAFAAFENFGVDELSLYWIPIDNIEASASFANHATKLALKLLRTLGH